MQAREDEVKLRRAYLLFNIDQIGFSSREKSVVEGDLRRLRLHGRAIFDTTSSQAFQIGFLMAVLSQVEILLPASCHYAQRLEVTKFVSALFLGGLNSFFSVPQTKHRSLSGYVTEGRAFAFEASEPGFRGLLASTNVRELNEKQWEFFRYMVFEIVHSKMASQSVLDALNNPLNAICASLYREKLPEVLTAIETLRGRYFEAAYKFATTTPEFKRQIDLLEMKARAEGKTDEQVKALVEQEVSLKKSAVLETCKAHLRASLGRLDPRATILKRLLPLDAAKYVGDELSNEEFGRLGEEAPSSENLAVAIVADDLYVSSSFLTDEAKSESTGELDQDEAASNKDGQSE